VEVKRRMHRSPWVCSDRTLPSSRCSTLGNAIYVLFVATDSFFEFLLQGGGVIYRDR